MKAVTPRTQSTLLSLTVMLLMVIALVAGQAGASQPQAVREGATHSAASAPPGAGSVRSPRIELEFGDLSISVVVDAEARRGVAQSLEALR